MQQAEKQLIEEKFRGVYSRLDANNEITNQRLNLLIELQERTHEQALKTNDRVTILEKQTAIIRWMVQNPLKSIGVIGAIGYVFNQIPSVFWENLKLFK